MNFMGNKLEWNDWKWQHAKSCKDLPTLLTWIGDGNTNPSLDAEQFYRLTQNYRMGVTPYYFSLIKAFNQTDPVFRQIIPSPEELNTTPEELNDPIGDEDPARGSRPLKALIHRYPNRVLMIPTAQCAVYCRFCFRKRLVGEAAHNAREEDLRAAFDYIRNHPEIEEVILTGGDPLTLGDQALQNILLEIESIKHVRLIRIHTRLPVVNPFRLTSELGQIIQLCNTPVWISAHFNHPNEITPTSRSHILDWVNRGIPFLNQNVLLKGVNDNADILKQLYMGLLEIKVKPYYLHQADMVLGTGHLRLRVDKGLAILKELQGELPGYALPHYILDQSDGSGKIPLQNQYLQET